MLSVTTTSETFRGGWGRGRGETKTHQLFIGRLYFFSSSGGFKAQYATTGNPLRGRGITIDSHTDLEGGERECGEMKTMNVKQKGSQ